MGKGGSEADVQQDLVPQYRYEIDIFWSEEDECFIACVPDLEKCAGWGTTYEEALARGHAAIRADLRSRRRVAGEPIPEPTPQYWPIGGRAVTAGSTCLSATGRSATSCPTRRSTRTGASPRWPTPEGNPVQLWEPSLPRP